MAVVQSRASRWLNRAAIALALAMLVIMHDSAVLDRARPHSRRAADATTVPPTVFFKPEITPFIKLFTKRVQQRGARRRGRLREGAVVGKAGDGRRRPLHQGRQGRDRNARAIRRRFLNSIIIAVSSTFLAVAMGTITAYGFSRFKMPGEDDWLFFILSTRMLPPVVVAIPMFLMYRAVGLVDTHIGLIILYTAFNLSFSVWLMKGFIDEIPEGVRGGGAGRRLHAHGGLLQDRAAAGGHRHRRHRRVLLHHGVERICLRADDDQPQRADRAALHSVAARLRPDRLDRRSPPAACCSCCR